MWTQFTKHVNRFRHPVTGRRSTVRRHRSNLNLENLEKRELFIVGAFGLPPVVGAGGGFDGVVQIDNGCTGTLLDSGRHILTAAHCVDFDKHTDGDGIPDEGDGTVDSGGFTVTFDMPWGLVAYDVPSSNVSVPKGNFNGLGDWNGDAHDGRDIAIMRLDQIAPLGAERFSPYRGVDEDGRWAYIVGYGRFGQGNNKVPINDRGDAAIDRNGCDAFSTDGQKRIGTNYFDDTDGPGNSELELDFDSDSDEWAGGSDPQNSLDWENEVGTAGGDSGGPSFLWGPSGLEVAAVTSRGTSDRCFDGIFDPGLTFTRVSSWAGWIDQQMAGPFDLTVDMSQQRGAADGDTEWIHVYDSNGTLSIFVNGETLHREPISNVRSLSIFGSSDADSVSLHLSGSRLPFDVDGGGGTDGLNLFTGSTNDFVYIQSNLISALQSRIDYTNFETLYANTGAGADYIGVYSAPANTQVTVNGFSGDDRIYVGSNLNSIGGNVSVVGGGGVDALTVNDLSVGGDTYSLDNTRLTVSRKPGWRLGHSGLETLSVDTGAGNDTVTSTANLFSLTAIVRGGSGNDTLVAGAGKDVLIGGSGDDVIRGGAGRDMLFGGYGSDTLDGQAGEDILFDGITSHDYSNIALTSLMNEWSRTDRSYLQRVAAMRSGVGPNARYRLDANTVVSDYYVDTLTGGADRDWFWAQEKLLLSWLGGPPVQPRDVLTDWVALTLPGQPDTSEVVN
jgi:hypothetical protein